jgi:hypothetical protein
MTARTALTVVQLARDTGNPLGAGATPDAANGNTIASPGSWKCKLLVHNGDSAAHSVTIRATGNGVTAAGAAQVSPAPSNTVYTQSTVGDLVVSVPAGDYYEFGPLTSDRFFQADGSVSIDYSASTSVTVWAIQEPVVIPS